MTQYPTTDEALAAVAYRLGKAEALLAESEAENDEWQRKVAQLWSEAEQLRTEIARLTLADRQWADYVKQLSGEVGRLKIHLGMIRNCTNQPLIVQIVEEAFHPGAGCHIAVDNPKLGAWHWEHSAECLASTA